MYIFVYNVIEVMNMCYVTATELKNNLSYYLEKSATEDIYITKNNRVISILMSPQLRALLEVEKMIDEIEIDYPEGKSDEDIIAEELISKHASNGRH
jgi:prevent-host-death family protein